MQYLDTALLVVQVLVVFLHLGLCCLLAVGTLMVELWAIPDFATLRARRGPMYR